MVGYLVLLACGLGGHWCFSTRTTLKPDETSNLIGLSVIAVQTEEAPWLGNVQMGDDTLGVIWMEGGWNKAMEAQTRKGLVEWRSRIF